jgi:hypothetical protein
MAVRTRRAHDRTRALALGTKGVRQRRAGSSTDDRPDQCPASCERESCAARTRSPGVAQVDVGCHPRADRNAAARTGLSEPVARSGKA